MFGRQPGIKFLMKGRKFEWEPLKESGAYEGDILIFMVGQQPLFVINEDEAKSTLKNYCDGCYVIFKKDGNLYLLNKAGSAFQQFAIYVKSNYVSKAFNLKNEKGEFIFPEPDTGYQSLRLFLNSNEVKKLFLYQLNLLNTAVWSTFRRMNNITLQEELLRRFVIHDSLPVSIDVLSPALQETAFYYFIDTFITATFLRESNFNSFVDGNLLNRTPAQLILRQHYSIEQLERNLLLLRTLYKGGCVKAGMLLAVIVNSGICIEDSQKEKGETSADLFRRLTKDQIPKTVYRDLEEYREITQNPEVFTDKTIRDLCLIHYGESSHNHDLVDTLLKQFDVIVASSLKQALLSDDLLNRCLAIQCDTLINQPVLHALMLARRVCVVNIVKDKLPESVLKFKDNNNQNILHVVIEYISAYHSAGIIPLMDLFFYISQRFSAMRAEQDINGNTVDALFQLHKTKLDERFCEQFEAMGSYIEENLLEALDETITRNRLGP